MLYNNKEIAKMLGRDKNKDHTFPNYGLGFGNSNTQTPMHYGRMPKANTRQVISEIRSLLDKLPDVKKAEGELEIEFVDGTKGKFKVYYK